MLQVEPMEAYARQQVGVTDLLFYTQEVKMDGLKEQIWYFRVRNLLETYHILGDLNSGSVTS